MSVCAVSTHTFFLTHTQDECSVTPPSQALSEVCSIAPPTVSRSLSLCTPVTIHFIGHTLQLALESCHHPMLWTYMASGTSDKQEQVLILHDSVEFFSWGEHVSTTCCCTPHQFDMLFMGFETNASWLHA